jgi:hypothetical protein
LPIEYLPSNALATIKNELVSIIAIFNKINQFTVESPNPGQQRNEFVRDIQAHSELFYNQTAQWVPFLAYQKGDVARNIEALSQSIKQAEHLLENTKMEISKKENEIGEIIVKAREASAAVGAAVFTQDFKKESENLKKGSRNWLIAAGGLALATLVIAGLMWYYAEPGLDRGQLFQKLGTKLAILVILITSTIWCGKIYKALMHLSTINGHRALSIQTLQAFVGAVENVQLKDAVVLEASRAIFGNVPTGYIDASNTSSDGDIKLFEIVKNLMPKSS